MMENIPKYQPRMNIVFLKMHKSASSSIQNILMRFGFIHDAVFVLPPTGNYLGKYQLFRKEMVPTPSNFSFNILTHHSRFNYEEMKQLMPPDTVFVTIMREPTSLFESMYDYYNMRRLYGVPLHLLHTSPKWNTSSRFYGKIGPNQMINDLGYDAFNMTLDGVQRTISLLDKQFDLVMITERMDQSLVLLKTLLRWDHHDVAVFKVIPFSEINKNS